MKVLMIGQKGIPAVYGGIERHVEELSVEFAKQGHDVVVYAREWYTPKNISHYHGVRIAHTPTLRTKHFDAIFHTFTSTIHALFQKPDVIHYHGVGPALLCWIPRIFTPKTKVVVTMHCLDRYHQKWGFLAILMLHIGEWAGCAFAHRQQNPELLKDYKLVIVGDSTFTDNYVANLRHIARGDNSIIFTGWQKGRTLDELYANCNLLIHPSENEGLPITVLQAMSHARPVLVSDISEHKEVISDERFWFGNTNIHSLTQKITELMQNPELLKEKGSKNKELVEKNYNWKDITNQTIALYSSDSTKGGLLTRWTLPNKSEAPHR